MGARFFFVETRIKLLHRQSVRAYILLNRNEEEDMQHEYRIETMDAAGRWFIAGFDRSEMDAIRTARRYHGELHNGKVAFRVRELATGREVLSLPAA